MLEREHRRLIETKKRIRPTDREQTTALYLLRAYQLGLRLDDLSNLSYGMVMDMMVEHGNDNAEYTQLATQADFDKF